MSVISLIPEHMKERFNELKLGPDDWHELHELLSAEDYDTVGIEYHNMEIESMPKCKAYATMCIYRDHGHCFYEDEPCRNQE